MQSLVETNSSPQQFGQIDRYSGNFLPLDSVQTENSVEDDVELKAKEVLRDPTFWEHATSQFDRCNDPIEEERKKRDELLDFLMERPAEALLSEATNFASIYYADRAIRTSSQDKETTVFFTRDSRNPNSQLLDSVTKLTVGPKGSAVSCRMDTFASITSGYEHPVDIEASSDGVVKVYSEIYQNGYTTRKEVTDPAFINEVIRTYLQMALRAGSVVKSRTPEVRAIADIDARNRYARREGMSTLESSYFAI